MKRRQFIKRSVATAIALTIPWSKLKAQMPVECKTTFQDFKWVNDNKDSYKIIVELCKETITNFEQSAADRKIINFTMKQNLKNAQDSFDIKEYKADLRIKSVKKMKDTLTDYKIETEFLQENKNEYELPKELNVKKLTLVFHQKIDISTIDVLDKKGNIYLTIAEKPPVAESDDDEDEEECFITTACTSMLGKPDDCTELTTLRKFRDEVLKANEEGLALIKEYYHTAPGIVKAIAKRNDKRAVYTDIYKQMIMPTILCIEKYDNKGAIRIYKDYTLKLKETYL